MILFPEWILSRWSDTEWSIKIDFVSKPYILFLPKGEACFLAWDQKSKLCARYNWRKYVKLMSVPLTEASFFHLIKMWASSWLMITPLSTNSRAVPSACPLPKQFLINHIFCRSASSYHKLLIANVLLHPLFYIISLSVCILAWDQKSKLCAQYDRRKYVKLMSVSLTGASFFHLFLINHIFCRRTPYHKLLIAKCITASTIL